MEGVFGQTSGGWLAGWLGNEGERLAARFLRRQGYKILARRYRTALGEIDLIARDGKWIVIVEVKTRRSDAAGQPHEAVDMHKQAQLTRLALAFLKRHHLLEHPARFDVVSIVWEGDVRRTANRSLSECFRAPGEEGQLFVHENRTCRIPGQWQEQHFRAAHGDQARSVEIARGAGRHGDASRSPLRRAGEALQSQENHACQNRAV